MGTRPHENASCASVSCGKKGPSKVHQTSGGTRSGAYSTSGMPTKTSGRPPTNPTSVGMQNPRSGQPANQQMTNGGGGSGGGHIGSGQSQGHIHMNRAPPQPSSQWIPKQPSAPPQQQLQVAPTSFSSSHYQGSHVLHPVQQQHTVAASFHHSPSYHSQHQTNMCSGSGTSTASSNVTSPGNSVSTSSSLSHQSPGISMNSNGGMRGSSRYSSSPAASITPSHEQLSKTNLYIRGLGPDTTDQDLREMCKKFGTITSTKAILDKESGKCKGFGFVDFESPSDAEKSLKGLQSEYQVQMARQQEQDPTNLYLANLSPKTTESDLEVHLSRFGHVISTRILRENNQSKCVGFARMESTEKCEQIIRTLNNQENEYSRGPLVVKFAELGNKKKKKEQQNWNKPSDVAVNMYDPSQIIAQNGNLVSPIPSGPYRQCPTQPHPYPFHPSYCLIPQAVPPVDVSQGYITPYHAAPYAAMMQHVSLIEDPVLTAHTPDHEYYSSSHMIQPK